MRKYPRGPKTPRPKPIGPGVTLLVPGRRRFPPGRHGGRKFMTLEKAGNRPRVVVVGAGFAGLYAVRGLKQSGYQVTLIEKNLYSTFQPLLYQVATGGLNPGDVSYAVGGYARQHHARYLRGELTAIDPGQQQLPLDDGRQLGYDYLILATGVASWPFGIKGAAEYTYGLYTRHGAVT